MRTLSEIYYHAKEVRDSYLELTEFKNSSKMSVLDAFTWTVAACIWAFENLLDVFQIDVAGELQNRIVGNARYYVNALLKYQSGDELSMNDEGTQFGYAQIDTSKRIITKVAYHEEPEAGFHDKKLVLKVAQGEPGNYSAIDNLELINVQSYINRISFAGTHVEVTSRHGDVLIPRVTVYCDGILPNEDMIQNITNSLTDYVSQLGFDEDVYVQKVIDAIQKTEHVIDVYIDPTNAQQGVFVAQYDNSNNLIATDFDSQGNPTSYIKRVERYFTPLSGFVKESSQKDAETDIEPWAQSLLLVIIGVPKVSTNNVMNITQHSALCGGQILEDGGQSIISKGVCWSTSTEPTVTNEHTNDGIGDNAYSSTITGLQPNTRYYVRAYAINSKGVSYGEQKSFTTSE